MSPGAPGSRQKRSGRHGGCSGASRCPQSSWRWSGSTGRSSRSTRSGWRPCAPSGAAWGVRIDRIYWYDATRPPRRVYTHLEWWIDETRMVERPVRDPETGATSDRCTETRQRGADSDPTWWSAPCRPSSRPGRRGRSSGSWPGCGASSRTRRTTPGRGFKLELLRGYVGRISREEARTRLEAFLRGFQGTFRAKPRERLEREAVAARSGRAGPSRHGGGGITKRRRETGLRREAAAVAARGRAQPGRPGRGRHCGTSRCPGRSPT